MTAVEVPDALRLHPEHGAAAWRALGTYVDVRTAPDALDAVVELVAGVLDEVDETCSRFRADSDLSLANASPGHPVLVSPVLAGAVRVALEAARETGASSTPPSARSSPGRATTAPTPSCPVTTRARPRCRRAPAPGATSTSTTRR